MDYAAKFVSILVVSPGQNGRHFADEIFKCIFLNEKFCILIRISLKFVPKDPNDNKWVLVQVMAWCRIGHKPLPESMLIQFTDAYYIYIYGTRGRWVKIVPSKVSESTLYL